MDKIYWEKKLDKNELSTFLRDLSEFENLNVNKTNKLLKRIGIKKKVDKPLSLADIYHYNDINTDNNNKPGIGFLVNRK